MDLNSIQAWLAGKKTYIAVVVAFVGLTSAWANGQVNNQKFIEDATALVLTVTVRAGVAKSKNTTVTTDADAIPDAVKQDLVNAGIVLKAKKKV